MFSNNLCNHVAIMDVEALLAQVDEAHLDLDIVVRVNDPSCHVNIIVSSSVSVRCNSSI